MHEVERLYSLSYRTKPEFALKSPADVFAVCAYFAKITGCYRLYAHSKHKARAFVPAATKDGQAWREILDRERDPDPALFPSNVRKHWELVGARISAPIEALDLDDQFVQACLALIVACDQACAGVGIPTGGRGGYFELFSDVRIGSGTLCRVIPYDALRVLPKQHTPQSGFNLRSLTHHLALCTASEVRPIWKQAPLLPYEKRPRHQRASYNLLLAPWPLEIESSDFTPARRKPTVADRFGYFDFAPSRVNSTAPLKSWLGSLLRQAEAMRQSIDLIVFPECALTEGQWNTAVSISMQHDAALIAGVRSPAKDEAPGKNTLRFKLPYEWQIADIQHKHHRWHIDESQITNYGMGGTLDRRKLWWENIELPHREVNFIAVRPELVICPLICEDLARQDPVGELVRSVGPNLVIALLMDGPQIGDRWSARYATVLADDPGCSVLTISSLGMVLKSRPRGCRPSRVVASWKDAFGQFVPLELANEETAMILNLQFREQAESSVDGRDDEGVATTPILCGIHPLK